MMGHREPMKGGGEYDALTRAKRYFKWRPGVRKWLKRKFNKRPRRIATACWDCGNLTFDVGGRCDTCNAIKSSDARYTLRTEPTQ
jgi:hypothetical protein